MQFLVKILVFKVYKSRKNVITSYFKYKNLFITLKNNKKVPLVENNIILYFLIQKYPSFELKTLKCIFLEECT